MSRAALCALCVFAGAASAEPAPPPPSNQTLVFYNARLSLREGKAQDVLKLWLLRNSLRQRGEQSSVDGDFRSVVWAALGDLGFCQDGFVRDDEGGAALWPLALHNYVARNLGKGPPPSQPAPWELFEAGRQQRFVSLNDVLAAEELKTVAFFRTGCLLPSTAALEFNQSPFVSLQDRLGGGVLMRALLQRSLATLNKDKVLSTAVIEARLFDLDLALAQLQARAARREGTELAQTARTAGASKETAAVIRSEHASKWADTSPQAALLRKSLTWSPREWLSLSEQRRLSLFAQARPLAKDADALRRLNLGIIDALLADEVISIPATGWKKGVEVEQWIGFLDAAGATDVRREVATGARGQRLLELEPDTGFRARAEVALHRGVAYLEAGALQDALRSFAYAMQHAEESRQPEATLGLARRWLSYVLSRFETTNDVLATLRALVPKQELNAVMEDLLWRAALRADPASFEKVVENTRRGGALDLRIQLLRPLANGKAGEMATRLRDSAKDEPHSALRFVRQYLEALEVEDAPVRRAHVPTLKLLLWVLDIIGAPVDGKITSQGRQAEELSVRIQAILDGLAELDRSDEGRARSLSVGRETFAGSIRLAPSDPLPWPFRVPEPDAPSAFTPLKLIPVEWRDAQDTLVFGWRLSE